MKALFFKQEDFKCFEIYQNFSFESIIYRNGNEIYKIFRTKKNKKGAAYDEYALENKRKKIILLNEMDLSSSFLKPDKLIFIDGVFSGYSMSYQKGPILYPDYLPLKRQKLIVLKKIKAIIEEAHQNGILLADINCGNFIIHKLNAFICDLDNSIIGNLKQDTENKDRIASYIKYHGFDYNLDFFYFDLICMYIMSNISFETALDQNKFYQTKLGQKKDFREFYEYFIATDKTDYEPGKILTYYDRKKIFRR